MGKVNWKPGTMLYPVPAVLVSCGSNEAEHNIITVAWTGTINTNPPMCYISLRKERHSYEIIKRNMEFVINLTTRKIAYATDWCGVCSGKDYDKFKQMKLTREKAQIVNAPLIAESPLNIECIVKEIKPLGSHDMFLSEIVAINADDKYIDPNTNSFILSKANPIAYLHGHYFTLGKHIGRFGHSVMKRKTKNKKKNKKIKK